MPTQMLFCCSLARISHAFFGDNRHLEMKQNSASFLNVDYLQRKRDPCQRTTKNICFVMYSRIGLSQCAVARG